jgi:hypothetical protein
MFGIRGGGNLDVSKCELVALAKTRLPVKAKQPLVSILFPKDRLLIA